jgi:hypothetical protein
MGANDSDGGRPIASIVRVRCLNCGGAYVKPAGGGTVSANPGCPECGYVGWVLERLPFSEGDAQSHSFAGRLRRRTG